MEKRALLAIVLSIAVMAVWQIFFVPSVTPPKPPAATTAPDEGGPTSETASETASPEAPQPAPAEGSAPAPAGTGPGVAEPEETSPAPPAEVIQAAQTEEFRVTTTTQDVRFTNKGGQVTWWRLTQFTIDGGIAVDLIPDEARTLGVLPMHIDVDGRPELTARLAEGLHVAEQTKIPAGDPAGTGPGTRVTLTYADGQGLWARKSLDLPDEGYLDRVSFEVRLDGKPLPATLVWASGLAQKSQDNTRSYGHVEGQAVINDGSEVVRMAAAKVDEPRVYSAATGTPVRWAGLESTYFASLVLAAPSAGDDRGPLTVSLTPHKVGIASSEKPVPLLTAGLTAETGSGSWTIFVGPKDYHLLASIGHGLQKVIDFSHFSLIYVITKWLFLALTWINESVGNYGWSIIILTVIVRVAFFPLTYKSMITMRQSSKKMSKVQPKVKAIQERYRKMKKSMETQSKMNQEVMALYKKEGVNPMGNLGGCLPLMLQMPIFIAFYNLLAVTIEMRQAPFIGWIHDLSRHDPYYITPILMGASWILQQAMTSSSIPDPTQRRMMMLMPIMFTIFMMNMPSGLVIYWLTSNLLGMGQQYLTNKKADQLETQSRVA